MGIKVVGATLVLTLLLSAAGTCDAQTTSWTSRNGWISFKHPNSWEPAPATGPSVYEIRRRSTADEDDRPYCRVASQPGPNVSNLNQTKANEVSQNLPKELPSWAKQISASTREIGNVKVFETTTSISDDGALALDQRFAIVRGFWFHAFMLGCIIRDGADARAVEEARSILRSVTINPPKKP